MTEPSKLLPEVYRDAVQPAAREIGVAVARSVRIALAPVRALAWTWEKAEEWVESAVSERFESRAVPIERIVSPRPQITASVLRGLQSAGPEPDETLRNLFANLLATAMDKERAGKAHPAFAEILGQLTTDEARLLRELARKSGGPLIWRMEVSLVDGFIAIDRDMLCEIDVAAIEAGIAEPDQIEAYLDNLERLGLVSAERDWFQRDHTLPLNGETNVNTIALRERWRRTRAYLEKQKITAIDEILRRFEDELVRLPASPPALRPAMRVHYVRSTSFGSQLLEAVGDPTDRDSVPMDATLSQSS